MHTWAAYLAKQRRFRRLLAGLLVLSLALGLVVVPMEAVADAPLIRNWFDGIWWAVTTITGVGYGDYYPVTMGGKILGMLLQLTGVLSFGLLISLVTVALDDAKERYNRQRLYERLDTIEKKLERAEKRDVFVLKRGNTEI